jgi:ribosomal protein S18 acetylase RimI-like enzyme
MIEELDVTRATDDDYNEICRDIVDFWDSDRTLSLHHVIYVHEMVDTSYVIREKGRVVAYLFGFVVEAQRLAYASLIGVRKEYRRRGLAYRLYDLFIEYARTRGCTKLRAVTTPSNQASIRFHTELGMTAHEVKDYAGRGKDRVVFEKAIG